ncbi:BZ3500_MvSof-1268-A1-R1_Chr12-1g03686 [Microbotryum saponariae]|uniref:BZ3500_MvSof-1268-A1-R1_Chr12-1g03686 protein n=1 Tax=Microbotryum saponariae TaxID=289078 RepID=A0A2X0MKQ6_9BASI|nr:BZ3500_MvSof-1268-A1-R1_Chr12-1g03686 [Microbotryum saponariae]SDA05279.1 BZ3501_MvSof-1269-A2-R1_Chr12-1g03263 [Microbotryum saponariae]
MSAFRSTTTMTATTTTTTTTMKSVPGAVRSKTRPTFQPTRTMTQIEQDQLSGHGSTLSQSRSRRTTAHDGDLESSTDEEEPDLQRGTSSTPSVSRTTQLGYLTPPPPNGTRSSPLSTMPRPRPRMGTPPEEEFDSGDSSDDPDFGREMREQAQREKELAEKAQKAQKALEVRQWNKEEKLRAKKEGRRPRLREMPKPVKKKIRRKGKEEEVIDDEETHRRKVRNGKRKAIEQEDEPCSAEDGEDDDDPRSRTKSTRPTFDPDAKAREVQKNWSNRIIEGKKAKEARIRAGMDITQAEIREHCSRKWVSRENPDQMTRKRYEMEKRYNPLFVMLDIAPIIVADKDMVENDSWDDDDEDGENAEDRVARKILAEHHAVEMDSDSDDGRSRRRGERPEGVVRRPRRTDAERATPPVMETIQLSSDEEPDTEDDSMCIDQARNTEPKTLNLKAFGGIKSDPGSEPVTENDSDSEPETEDDDDVPIPRSPARVLKTEDEEEEEEEVDAFTAKFLEQQKRNELEKKQAWVAARLEAVTSSQSTKTESQTSNHAAPEDSPKRAEVNAILEAEEEEAEIGEMSLLESQRIIKDRRLAAETMSQSTMQEKRIVKGCRPRFNASPQQLEIGDHILSPRHRIPAPINRFLRHYQREGIEFLYKQYSAGMGGILGDDMGLGKTIQVIGFLSAVMGKSGTKKLDAEARKRKVNEWDGVDPPQPSDLGPTALIICPASVTENWYREIKTWSYLKVGIIGQGKKRTDDLLTMFRSGHLDVLISGYEHVKRQIDVYRALDFSIIIADEVHRAKSRSADTTASLHAFPTKLRYGLTGTAVQNRLGEFHTILDWACPGKLGTWQQWRDLVEKPLKFAQSSEADQTTLGRGRIRAWALVTGVLPHFFLRRTKHQPSVKLQLPKKTDNLVLCPLTPLQRQAYQNITATDEVQMILTADQPCPCGRTDSQGLHLKRGNCCNQDWSEHIFRYMHAFGKVSNHLALIYPNKDDSQKNPTKYELDVRILKAAFPEDWKGRSLGPGTALDESLCGKWKVLEELLDVWYEARDKVLIFSNSLRVLKLLEDLFQFSKFPSLTLTGETKQEEREPNLIQYSNLKHLELTEFLSSLVRKPGMARVDQFNDPNGEAFCFLISTKAGGVGLNLTAANKVVIFDPNFNPSHDLQAMDRSYRFGQTREVNVYRLIGAGTIEEIMINRQQMKRGLANVAYDAAPQPRLYTGIEGSKAHEGELFGVRNLLTLKTSSLTHRVVENAAMEDANFAKEEAEEETEGKGEEAEPWQGADEVVNEIMSKTTGEGPKSKAKTEAELEIDRILSGLTTVNADSTLVPSKLEAQRGAKAMAKEIEERDRAAAQNRRAGKRSLGAEVVAFDDTGRSGLSMARGPPPKAFDPFARAKKKKT